jgi:hypothetical protein
MAQRMGPRLQVSKKCLASTMPRQVPTFYRTGRMFSWKVVHQGTCTDYRGLCRLGGWH